MRRFFLLFFAVFIVLLSSPKIVARAKENIVIYGDENIYHIETDSFYGFMPKEKIGNIVNEVDLRERRGAIPARLKMVDGNDKPIIVKGKEGKSIDKEKLMSDLSCAVAVGGGAVRLSYEYDFHPINTELLKNCLNLRGRFTTYFPVDSERNQNIGLAGGSIDGCMVESGQTFSFNKVVGPRSRERGYKMAKIILGGNFVEGVGGGVCQVSTTLYNAVLVSGLKVTEHHPHSLAVSYIEKSFDAMVTDAHSDLKFVNNTKFPIFIFSKIGENYITFSIYGAENCYEYRRESVILEEITPFISKTVSEDLSENEERVVISPKIGYRSQGYLNKCKNGVVIEREKLREDKYLAVNGITEVGKNGHDDE